MNFHVFNSPLAQWHSLVTEAEACSHLILPEELESYVVYLLMRFSHNTQLANSVLALDFLNSLQEMGKVRSLHLQVLGDKCLLLAGLFPDFALRKQLNPHYFIDMGQLAYGSLHNTELDSHHPNLVYGHLCHDFTAVVKVMQMMRKITDSHESTFSSLRKPI